MIQFWPVNVSLLLVCGVAGKQQNTTKKPESNKQIKVVDVNYNFSRKSK